VGSRSFLAREAAVGLHEIMREVDEAHDFKVFTMGRLRAEYAPERARLGKELAQEISQELHDHGYSHLPEPLPTRQEQHVYIYGDQSPMAELIHYIGSEPDELGGAFLRFVAKALAKGAETLH
jgi:hypothetical protein